MKSDILKGFICLLIALFITGSMCAILFVCATGFSKYAYSGQGTRIKIAVIDSGINSSALKPYLCDGGHIDLTGNTLTDVVGHGTNVTSIIVKNLNPKTHCIVIIKWFHNDKAHLSAVSPAITKAIEDKVSYINMSLSGYAYDAQEFYSIQKALDLGIVVVVAAGNNGKNLGVKCDIYPACYPINNKNYYVVANFVDDVRFDSSNFGGPVNAFENGVNINAGGYVMTGTSQAAAKFMNDLLKGNL